MATYPELLIRAKKMGHKLTPELRTELKMLAAIPDEGLRIEARKAVVNIVAKAFEVSPFLAEQRMGDAGPFAPTKQKEPK